MDGNRSKQSVASRTRKRNAPSKFEHVLESSLFCSRWLMAPLYVGLIFGLAVIVWTFLAELYSIISDISHTSPAHVAEEKNNNVLHILSLLDLSLVANLVFIVVMAGYSHFVSKIDAMSEHRDEPSWMDKANFGAIKAKLLASLVAISAIQLLQVFFGVKDKTIELPHLYAMIAVHVTFLGSALVLVFIEYVTAKTELYEAKTERRLTRNDPGDGAPGLEEPCQRRSDAEVITTDASVTARRSLEST